MSHGRAFWAVSGTALFLIGVIGFYVTNVSAVEEEKEKEKGAGEVGREQWKSLEEYQKSSPTSAAVEEDASDEDERRGSAMTAQLLIEEKKIALEEEDSPEEKETLEEELKRLQKELLRFPKRDRFNFGGDFDLTYDNNPFRNVIRSEEGDTLVKMAPNVEVDLGGRKTDVRAEYRWNRQYNAKVPEGRDTLLQEMTVRSGRKIGKKTTVSLNDRLSYQSQRVDSIDDDGKQIRWDNSHQASLNHKANRKLTVNFDTDYTRSDFPHENFDQDGNYQFEMEPSAIFQITPKTQLSGGYRITVARPKTEGTDTTQHQFRAGYTGKLTGKSSLSIDLAHTLQDPDTAQAGRSDTTTTSVGYIWQTTPKVSLRLFYSNSFQHLISDSLSGRALLKTTTRTSSDNFSSSIRFRLHRKVNTEFSFDGSHAHSKTRETGVANVRSRTWTFPFQLAVDFQVTRWVRLRFAYTYRHQIGNEDSNQHRAHTWFFGSNIAFA